MDGRPNRSSYPTTPPVEKKGGMPEMSGLLPFSFSATDTKPAATIFARNLVEARQKRRAMREPAFDRPGYFQNRNY